MKKLLCALAILTVAAGIPAVRAGVLFPPAKDAVTDSTIVVMALIKEKDPRVLSVKDEAGKESKFNLEKGYIRQEVPLSLGKNIIQLGGDTREVFVLASGTKPPEGYRAYRLHEAMDDCENCHAAEGKEGALKSAVPELCFDCHDDFAKGTEGKPPKSIHGPVKDGDCTSCHSPHFSAENKLLNSPVPDLCGDCHDPMNQNREKKPFAYQHDPVKSGDCLDCHLPHASENAALTVKGGEKLCAGCHDDFSLGSGGKPKKYIHDPVKSGECESCHLVHGSDNKKLLTVDVEKLCGECHDNVTLDKAGKQYPYPHEPVQTQECLACHDVHASEFTGMMKKADNELCLECHDDPKIGWDGKPMSEVHSALDEGCLACHSPHGSDFKKLVNAPGGKLCLECHTDLTSDKGGNFEERHPPVTKTQCELCHVSHASAQKGLLSAKSNDLCKKCHTQVHERHRTRTVRGGGRFTTRVPDDFPVDRQTGDLICVGCHQPHGGHFALYFRTEKMSLCQVCHNI